jgi:4-amino-4-deoxy-L-arabinose transferase-like glycosyltransferase
VLLAAFGLRLVRLGEQNIWWDEGLAFWAVRQGLLEVTAWTAGDVHPPVFFWLLWLQVRLAGESEFAGRFVALAAGVLTVALAIPVGRLLGGWRVALLAALLLAVARFPVWWSQELRMYAPATAFALAACFFTLRAVQRRRWCWGYVAAASLALWTLYLSAAVLLALSLFVALALLRELVNGRWRAAVTLGRHWLGANLLVGALFGGWILFASGRMRSWSTAEPIDFGLFVRLYAVVMTTGISVDIDRLWPGVLAALLLLGGLGLFALHPRGRGPGWAFGWLAPLLIALVVPAAVWYATQPRALFYSPRLEARYFLLAAPAGALLVAAALGAALRAWRPLGVVASAGAIIVSGLFTLDYLSARRHRDEFDSVVAALRAYARPDDGVVLVSGDRGVLFSYLFLPGVPAQPRWYGLPYTVPATTASAAGDIGPIAERHQRIWLVAAEAHLQDPTFAIAAWLDAHRPKVYDQPNGYNRLTLYDRAGRPPTLQTLAPQTPLVAPLGSGRQLLGYDLPARRLAPGDVGHVALYWRAAGAAAGPIVLRLRDRQGVPLEEWVLDDRQHQAGEVVRQQVEFAVYRYTPAGRYQVEVESAAGTLPLAPIDIIRTESPPGLPARTILPPGGVLGPGLHLLGFELASAGRRLAPGDRVRPGDQVDLTLYWQPTQRLDRPWVVFAHLIGGQLNPANGTPVWGQADGYPLGGEFPTQQWRPGQVVRDQRSFTVAPTTPAGEYLVEVGWYWPPTGERLPSADEQGRLILTSLVVAEGA